MATRALLTPYGAEFPSTNFPQLLLSNRRPALAFDTTTSETCYWTLIAPQGLTGTLTLVITYALASATSGTVAFDVAVEAITEGDAVDTDGATSFDSVNNSTTETVPGTAGYIDQTTVTLTNADSVAAGDYVRISLARDVTTDSAAGDAYVFCAELRDAA